MIANSLMILEARRRIYLFLCLLLIAGCNSQNEGNHETSLVEPPRRDRIGNKQVKESLVVRPEFSLEIEQMAESLQDGSTRLNEWWDLGITDSERRDVIASLFASHPDLAKSLVEAAPDAMRGMLARQWLVRAWSLGDPLGCYNWIESSNHLNSGQQSSLRAALVTGAALLLHDGAPPEPWVALLRELKANRPESRLIGNLEAQLVVPLGRTMPLARALAILESAGPLTTHGLQNLINASVEVDPLAALAFLESRPADKAAWLESGGDVVCVRKIATSSPSEAFEWAINRDDPSSAERSVRAAVTAWLPLSSQDASTRVASLPRGDIKDAAIVVMVDWLHRMESTDEIAPWLDELSSGELRNRYQALREP